MKNLEFVTSGNKLEIVGLTEDGKAYVETLKVSSRRVKPGAERFVIKAFNAWVQSGKPTAFQKAMSKDIGLALEAASAAAFCSNLLQSNRPSGISSDADAIIRANCAAQKRFGQSLNFNIIEGTRDGACTVTVSAGGVVATGRGPYFKAAKASAAREFLSRIK